MRRIIVIRCRSLNNFSQIQSRPVYIGSEADSATRHNCQKELLALLDAWADFPPECFVFDESCPYIDIKRPTPDTQNKNLELTWLSGNLIRAAAILKENPPADAIKETQETLARFKAWSTDVINSYVTYSVFPAGMTNRKASQIETLLRHALLHGDQNAVKAQIQAFEKTLEDILPNGELCEDSLRDKYHPQFYIGSSLQIAQIVRNKLHQKIADPILKPSSTEAVFCPLKQGALALPDDAREAAENSEAKGAANNIAQRVSGTSGGSSRDLLSWFAFTGNLTGNDDCSPPTHLPACREALSAPRFPKPASLPALERAILFTAEANMNTNPPSGYASPQFATHPPQDWHPAYDIGIWYLAGRYMSLGEKELPPAVRCMTQANYDTSGKCKTRFDLGKVWGYSALAEAYQL